MLSACSTPGAATTTRRRDDDDDDPHHDREGEGASSPDPVAIASRRRPRPRPREDQRDAKDDEEEEDQIEDEIVLVPAKRARLDMRLALSSGASSSVSPDPIAVWLDGQNEAHSSLHEASPPRSPSPARSAWLTNEAAVEEEPYMPASELDPLEADDCAGWGDEEACAAVTSAGARCDAEVQCERGDAIARAVLLLALVLLVAVVVLLLRPPPDEADDPTRTGFEYVACLLAQHPHA